MTQILHIVGKQGSGKSTLARQIQTAYKALGITCENLTELDIHEPGQPIDLAPFRLKERNNVVMVEHLDTPHGTQMATGDLVIHVERVQ